MKKRFLTVFCPLLTLLLILSGCGKDIENQSPLTEITESQDTNSSAVSDISIDTMDMDFTDNDRNTSEDNSKTPKVNKGIITITDGGTYTVTGNITQIRVNAKDTDKPRIILKNAQISCNDGPAIYIEQADKVFITLPEGSESSITDGETYSDEYENADGAIFSKADLTLNGGGKLTVNGMYKCAIVSKDDLVICDTQIKASSKGSCIEGKDCLKLSGAELHITAGADGIKSTNAEDASRGFIYIESGNYNITAENDGIQAETALIIADGEFSIKTGGGSAVSSTKENSGWGNWGNRGNWGGPMEDFSSENSTDTPSAKAIKSRHLIKISGGSFKIDSSDDSIHSNSDIEIGGGSFELSSGDDGIHADDQLIINNGTVNLLKSYEGLEATVITLNGGNIDITASDDGLNAAGGNDSSAMGGRPGQNPFESDSDAKIEINGGYILINASGDGVDSNGDININDGILLVSGPTNSGNGALDTGGDAYIKGGTAIFTGSSGMAEVFSENSAQPSLGYTLSSTVNQGVSISITDKTGNVLASFLPSKTYNHVVISCPTLKKGSDYNLCVGGNITKTDKNGYTASGRITDADDTLEVTLSAMSTTYGSTGMGGGMHGGMPEGVPGGMPGGMRGESSGFGGKGGRP